MTFERLMQSTGRTFYSMITQGTGAIINIILDPIMIFGLFGFPRLGIRGAAIATVTGQIIAMLLAVYLNHTKNPDIRLSLRGFKPNKRVIGLIYTVGVPSIVMQSITRSASCSAALSSSRRSRRSFWACSTPPRICWRSASLPFGSSV